MIFNLEDLEITKEFILNKVSEYQIFNHYCKNFKDVNKNFSSEFRSDSKPSCRIYNYQGKLIYKDFGTNETYDCFSYIKEKFRVIYNIDLNFKEILKIISNDFNIIESIKDFKVPKSFNYIGLADKYENKTRIISIKKRKWYKSDTYWNDYYINEKILNFYNVIPVSHYWLNSNYGEMQLIYDFNKNFFDPCYSYEEGNGLRKLLRPYAEYKWIGNIPRNVYSGFKQLDSNSEILIVTSSLKDVMAWRLFNYNSISPQSESIFLNENTLELLSYRFKYIIVNYDNDLTGLKRMQDIVDQFPQVKRFITEKKDLSDNLYFKGYESTQKLIKNFKNNLF